MSSAFSRGFASRLPMIVGAAVLTFGGLATAAQAAPLGHMSAGGIAPEAVQYYEDGGVMHRMSRQEMRRQRQAMDRYGENYHPNHPGHAGLYDCGPGGKNTRLSRRACGGNDRFAHIDGYRYE